MYMQYTFRIRQNIVKFKVTRCCTHLAWAVVDRGQHVTDPHTITANSKKEISRGRAIAARFTMNPSIQSQYIKQQMTYHLKY